MQRKFIPKIVPRVVPDSKPVTDLSGGAAESIFILRVKRRRDESAAKCLLRWRTYGMSLQSFSYGFQGTGLSRA